MDRSLGARLRDSAGIACLSVILLVASAEPALTASGINLAWGECGRAGARIRSFACDTNIGADVLVGSFASDSDISDLRVVEVDLDLYFADRRVPAWWEIQNSGSCRAGALSVLHPFYPDPPACADLWEGGLGGWILAFDPNFGQPPRARITLSLWASPNWVVAVARDREYYAYQLAIRRVKTVGADACSGCHEPALIYQTRLLLESATGAITLNWPIDSQDACWQCDCFLPLHADWPIFGPCPPTPALNRTWGAVKALYR